jgi:two-component system cell cycle sensor histidine kinase/response regulator CckA
VARLAVGYVDAMGAPGDRDDRSDDRAFRVLCETCGIGFWHIDTRGHTVYANPAICLMLEVDSASDLQGITHHAFFTEASLQRMDAEHRRRSSGVASTYEVELLGRRGGRRNIIVSGVPVTDAGGALTGLFGSFTDITPRKRAELARAESDNRLRSLFAASVDAIGVSRDGVHVMINPAYVRMFGYVKEEELLGRPILDLIAPAERAAVASHVRLRSRGMTDVQHYLTRGVRRGAQEFPLEVHVSSYEQDGEVQSVVILRDISDRLQLEEQLRQSQKMDALGRLAGGVAHDFNNLLTVIMSCTDLVLTALPEHHAAAENVRLIRSTGERAATLTRQLLALSRRQVIDAKVIDLNVVVCEMGAMLRRLIGTHIVLTVDGDPALSRVRVDAGQLQQVLMNLCVNARDAMPDGGRLTVSTRNVHLDERYARSQLDVTAGHFVLLSVADTGHGMSPETQERLFEPFFTTKALGHGTGLGLSTVYGIVKQSGGHVSATSAVGEGTTFHVYLPAVDAPVAGSSVESETHAVADGVTGTVLLVEDESALRQLVHRFLSRAGYRVLAAANGVEALALFSREAGDVDVVVTDMLMPGMSGVELARELDQRAPGIHILFMSGYAREDAAIPASRPGSAFLAKPFTLPELTAQVRALIALRRVISS